MASLLTSPGYRMHKVSSCHLPIRGEDHGLLLPATAADVQCRATAGGERIVSFIPYTAQFNMTGQPAISLPLHWTPAGLPVGVQLAAAYGREDILIQVASQLEQAAPWSERHPPIHA